MNMRFEQTQTLDHYLEAGDETTKELLGPTSPYRHSVQGMYDWFTKTLLADDVELRAIPALLAVNAFMLWLASVRIAATGHAVATYPLFRVAMESACYSLVTQRDEAKETIWRERDSSPAATKLCRDAMTGAAKDAARIINLEQAGSGEFVTEGYQQAIGWGAHPNANSIFRHIQPPREIDEKYWLLTVNGLGGPEATEVRRTLIASLEYGFLIGLILLRAIENATQEQADALGLLHDQKEQLASAWFQMPPWDPVGQR